MKFTQALRKLIEGKKMQPDFFDDNEFIQLKNNRIVSNEGTNYSFDECDYVAEWGIYNDKVAIMLQTLDGFRKEYYVPRGMSSLRYDLTLKTEKEILVNASLFVRIGAYCSRTNLPIYEETSE